MFFVFFWNDILCSVNLLFSFTEAINTLIQVYNRNKFELFWSDIHELKEKLQVLQS